MSVFCYVFNTRLRSFAFSKHYTSSVFFEFIFRVIYVNLPLRYNPIGRRVQTVERCPPLTADINPTLATIYSIIYAMDLNDGLF